MADLVGKVLSRRYRVDAFIGKGGMAEVYKVWDRERAVFLAMKVLYSDLAEDKVFLRRFLREAETLSSLQHPHIVRFYGMEEDNGLSFMLMDYVEGTTLRRQVFDARRPFSAQQIMQIMRPVCSALYYAHERGRVHCDVKPANIMVKSNGEVLVADFGIARLMESSTTTTMVGAGTPAYMAPEQVLGKKPSPQTDIYSLGIVLYEMLTGGERPFTGEQARLEGTTSEKVRWEQVKLPPPSPRKNNPAISTELERVVLNCLMKDPAQRYASTLELLQALEIALEGARVTQDFAKQEVPIRQSVAEVMPSRQEILKEPPSKARMRGIGIVVGMSIFIGIVLIVMIGSRFLGNPINGSPTVIASVDGNTISVPTATQAFTEDPPTPSEVATTTPEPTEDATMTASALATEINDRGAVMVLVPEGEFTMGSNDPSAAPDQHPAHDVYLDTYYIDKFEVTNALYAACVATGTCRRPEENDFPGYGKYFDNPNYAEYPVVFLDWAKANVYCEWRKAGLPTEAQWEKAARGTDGRIYPWGNEAPSCQKANFREPCYHGTTKVGSYPDGKSPYGAFDMAGNVWEWVADWYSSTYYETGLLTNPLGPTTGQERVIRGGSWTRNASSARAFQRAGQSPAQRDIGFRCARNASP